MLLCNMNPEQGWHVLSMWFARLERIRNLMYLDNNRALRLWNEMYKRIKNCINYE
jgi:hypothetical protein